MSIKLRSQPTAQERSFFTNEGTHGSLHKMIMTLNEMKKKNGGVVPAPVLLTCHFPFPAQKIIIWLPWFTCRNTYIFPKMRLSRLSPFSRLFRHATYFARIVFSTKKSALIFREKQCHLECHVISYLFPSKK